MTDLEIAFNWLGDSKNIEALKKIKFKNYDRLKNVPWTVEEKKQVETWPGIIYGPLGPQTWQERWEKWLLERGLLEQLEQWQKRER